MRVSGTKSFGAAKQPPFVLSLQSLSQYYLKSNIRTINHNNNNIFRNQFATHQTSTYFQNSTTATTTWKNQCFQPFQAQGFTQLSNWRQIIQNTKISSIQARTLCSSNTTTNTSTSTSTSTATTNTQQLDERNIELQKKRDEILSLSNEELQKRAEDGDPECLFLIGWYHYWGEKGFEKNMEKTVSYYERAAEKKHAHAFYLLAQCYFEGIHYEKNESKAVEMMKSAAALQHIYAQYDLGCCYYYGNGTTKDIHKAIEYFEIAGKRGQGDALSLLGSIYYYGEEGFIEVDKEKGIKYFEAAAKMGDKDALYNLGCYYLEGDGVEKNISKAVEYLTSAAEKDDSDACFNLANLYFHGEDGLQPDEAKGLVFCKKAAALGDVEAQFVVGQMLVNDQNTFDEGASFLRFAANRGHDEAKSLCEKLKISFSPSSL